MQCLLSGKKLFPCHFQEFVGNTLLVRLFFHGRLLNYRTCVTAPVCFLPALVGVAVVLMGKMTWRPEDSVRAILGGLGPLVVSPASRFCAAAFSVCWAACKPINTKTLQIIWQAH